MKLISNFQCNFYDKKLVACFQVCSLLNPLLEEHFPVSSGVQIIAEPGRFYSASAFTLVVNVVARRTVKGSQLKECDKTANGAVFKDTDELVSWCCDCFIPTCIVIVSFCEC